jgi:hypothetical protein
LPFSVPFMNISGAIISPHKSSTFRAAIIIILSRDRRKMSQQTPDYDLSEVEMRGRRLDLLFDHLGGGGGWQCAGGVYSAGTASYFLFGLGDSPSFLCPYWVGVQAETQ